MHVAFYAPLKPPTHPVPSGDRRMARLLMQALRRAGHRVELASRLRSLDVVGDPRRQIAIAARGRAVAERLVARYRALPRHERPAAWFTYHLYHKAPDWLGPPVADALGIPYLVAEASHAPKRAQGPWAAGHAAAAAAIARADVIFTLNPSDAECLMPLLAHRRRLIPLKPFLDTGEFAASAEHRTAARRALVRRYRLAGDQVWLLTVAMMRPGDKLASYRLLADALEQLEGAPWQLLVVGDGEMRTEVREALRRVGAGRAFFAGAQPPPALSSFYAAADLCIWPAVNEAYGMTLLEAQAAGLPVVAGAFGGVPTIVADETSGLLTTPGDATAFAAAVAALIDDPQRRRTMAAAARRRAVSDHDIAVAARLLDSSLRRLVADRRRC